MVASYAQQQLGLHVHTASIPGLVILGGPGAGKTFISNCAIRLIHHLQPESTLRAAYTHRAARLIGGQTLHSCCALPFDSGTGSATAVSLGSQKDALQLLWKHISTFLIDEASMLSNEVISFLDLRCKQIKNVAAILWGGLAVRLPGDFHQLPPVGATSLIRPLPSLPGLETSTSRQQAMIGADIWRQISTVLILDHSHRCQGPLQDLLQDLASDKGLTQASWQQLQSRLVHAGDQRLLETKFRPKSAPVGVMRHSIRVLKTLQRAEAGARDAQHRLLLATCADRCSFENRSVPLTAALGQEAASVHALSATGNLPAIVALYPGVVSSALKRDSALSLALCADALSFWKTSSSLPMSRACASLYCICLEG